jgi:hypothetical protein
VNEKDGRFVDAGIAGEHRRLKTSEAALLLSDTTVVGSGPTGPSVTLNLALKFKPRSAAGSYTVEVAALDDAGHQSEFRPAGTLTVLPA